MNSGLSRTVWSSHNNPLLRPAWSCLISGLRAAFQSHSPIYYQYLSTFECDNTTVYLMWLSFGIWFRKWFISCLVFCISTTVVPSLNTLIITSLHLSHPDTPTFRRKHLCSHYRFLASFNAIANAIVFRDSLYRGHVIPDSSDVDAKSTSAANSYVYFGLECTCACFHGSASFDACVIHQILILVFPKYISSALRPSDDEIHDGLLTPHDCNHHSEDSI
jgi:hypothetical protein